VHLVSAIKLWDRLPLKHRGYILEKSLCIRRVTSEDMNTLADFNTAMALETENRLLDKDITLKGAAALLENPAYGFYLMAEYNGEVAGSLMVTYEWSDWRNKLYWWVQSVYIKPEFRRKGIFRAMYESLTEQAKEAGNVCGLRLYVEKENKRAQTTYAELGMTPSHYLMYETDL